MYIFKLGEKIYAVFDESSPPDWDQRNKYDASPDGLSGKKEGFYFANWLMPFRVPFTLNQVSFSPNDYPDCIKFTQFDCKTCQFFFYTSCPILTDKKNLDITRKGFEVYLKLVYCPRGYSDSTFEVARNELLSHGRPLHFQFLCKILRKRHSNLEISDRKLLKILKLNPHFFINLENGVYQAIPGIIRAIAKSKI